MSLLGSIGSRYKSWLDNALRGRGLRLDDYLPGDKDVLAALRLLPPEQYIARQRRIYRAIDNNLKHVELSGSAKAAQQPFKSYGLYELAQDMKNRRVERETYQ